MMLPLTNRHAAARPPRSAGLRPGVFAQLLMAASFAALLLGLSPAFAATPDPLQQGDARQRQLQRSVNRAGEQFRALLAEYERNGLAGEEAAILAAVSGIVDELGEEDMERILTLLGEARTGADPAVRRRQLLDALGAQKTVGMKLRRLLLQYGQVQEFRAITARLEDLARRQHANLAETAALSDGAARQRNFPLAENREIAAQLQASEQEAIRDELAALAERLDLWAAEPGSDKADRARGARALFAELRATELAEAALSDLRAARFLSSAGRQRATRESLRRAARLLGDEADRADVLREAVTQLDTLLERQEAARQANLRLPDQAADRAPVQAAQGEIADRTDMLRADLDPLVPEAVEHLGVAVEQMQDARGVLLDAPPDMAALRAGTAGHQEVALARLQQARALLQRELEELERLNSPPADPRERLAQLREEVEKLIQLETALRDEAKAAEPKPDELRPLAPRQGDIRDRTADAESAAAPVAPEAAESLADAARQMQKSQRALGESRNDPAAQQAALDALAQAARQLAEAEAALEQAAKDLAEVEALIERLIAIIEAQTELRGQTARLAAGVEALPARAQATRQTDLAAQTELIEPDAQRLAPRAAPYLADAVERMVGARDALKQPAPDQALPLEDAALAALNDALRELQARKQELQQMLGQPPEGPSLAELQQELEAAQAEVSEAMAAEETQPMMQPLNSAERRVRPMATGRRGPLPRMIQQPVARAQAALARGAAQAEAGQQGEALSESTQAQEAIAEALAALAVMQAGMGGQPGQMAGAGQGQGQGQGQGGGQGQGQGQGQGKGNAGRGKGRGDQGNFSGAGDGEVTGRDAGGQGKFIGLPPRDREAIRQSRGEPYPREFAPQIEQYFRNLSDEPAAGTPP
ncbi:MAG: hypothetical protein ACKVYV_05870 [Limisphaerales bacterium]